VMFSFIVCRRFPRLVAVAADRRSAQVKELPNPHARAGQFPKSLCLIQLAGIFFKGFLHYAPKFPVVADAIRIMDRVFH
jgi:hypothetical protein